LSASFMRSMALSDVCFLGWFVMECIDIDCMDHDPDLAHALWNMIVAWSRAETSLVNTFATISGMHFNIATIAYYRIPTFEARVKVIQAMLTEWRVAPPVCEAGHQLLWKSSASWPAHAITGYIACGASRRSVLTAL